MPPRHGPNTLRNYASIHETIMEQFYREGFVESDGLELVSVGNGLFLMQGTVSCLGGLICTVEKWMETVDAAEPGNPRIKTFRYSYNVSLSGVCNLFRYDNADHHGQVDSHHRHEFDPVTGAQLPGSPQWIGAARWPTLGEVLREMADWYWNRTSINR